jgi:hypothetical protein
MDPLNQFLAWILQAIRTAVNPVAVIALMCALGMCFIHRMRGAATVAGATVVIWLMLHADSYLSFLGSH